MSVCLTLCSVLGPGSPACVGPGGGGGGGGGGVEVAIGWLGRGGGGGGEVGAAVGVVSTTGGVASVSPSPRRQGMFSTIHS